MKDKNKSLLDQLREKFTHLENSEKELRAANQQLTAGEQQLRAANQQLTSSEQQLRAANQQLIASEEGIKREKEFSESLLETANAFILTLDLNANITLFNKFAENLTGYKKDEVLGKNWFELFIPKRKGSVILEVFSNTIKEMLEFSFYENLILCKNGSAKLISWSNTVLKNENGEISGVLSIGKDITERKKAEEELNRNFQQQKLLTEISFIFSKLGNFDENMKEVLRLLGDYTKVSRVYAFEDFKKGKYTKNTFEWCNTNIEPQIDNLQEVPYKMIPSWKKLLSGKGMVLSSNIMELPQDLIDMLEPQKIKSIFVLPIYVKDQFFGFVGFNECGEHRIWDKSEIELLKTVSNIISTFYERKQAQEVLEESEERFRVVMKGSSIIVSITNRELRYVWIQNSHPDFDPEAVIGKRDDELADNEGTQQLMQLKQQVIEREVGTRTEITFLLSTGSLTYDVTAEPLRDTSGRVIGVTTVALDITERKRAEKKLLDSENRFREQYQGSPTATFTWQKSGEDFVLADYNKAAEAITNGRVNEYFGKTMTEMYQNRQDIREDIHRCFTEKKVIRNEVVSRDFMPGKYIMTNYSFIAPDLVLVHVTDITERKQAEEELRESELQLRQIIDLVPHFIFVKDETGKFKIVNKAVAKAYGTTVENLTSKSDADFASSKEEAKQFRLDDLEVIRSGKMKFIPEEPITDSKNNIRYLQTTKVPFKFSNTKKSALLGVSVDITERKQAEEALKENEKRYKQIYQFSPDSVIIHDMDMNILDVNNKAVEEFGYSKKELLEKTIYELHPETEQKHSAQVLAAMKQKDMLNVETAFVRKDGSVFLAEATPCKYTLGSKPIIHAVIRDITERKQAEEALKKNEQFLNSILESVQDGVSVINPDLTIRHVNGIMNKWYKENLPLEGKKCYEAYHNADKPCDPCPTLRCLESGKTEWNVVAGLPGSPVKWIELFSYPIKDQNSGAITAVVEFVRDITERKQAEEKLKESEENFKNIFHSVPESLLAVNKQIKVLKSNNAFAKLIIKYAPELNMSEDELKQIILSELRKQSRKTKHGIIEISAVTGRKSL